MDQLVARDLASVCLEIFLSAVDFSFDSLMVRECTVCDFLKNSFRFAGIYFMGQSTVCLGEDTWIL